ncbi:MAG: hypothetical protein WBK10_04780, partial [Bacillota bacterium]|jgi:stage III sporulation protein AA|nr:stage III sporulation protein AA [Bacillota bacterium]
METDIVLRDICPALPGAVRRAVESMHPALRRGLNEVRLRKGRQVCVVIQGVDYCLSANGETSASDIAAAPLVVGEAAMSEALRLVTGSSVYALQRELAQGYITLPGGHRVGVVGRAVTNAGEGSTVSSAAHIRTQSDVSSMNYRVARALPGVADAVMHLVLRRGTADIRVLVVSPPGEGKTTLLRDIARQLASGSSDSQAPMDSSEKAGRGAVGAVTSARRPPIRVGVVDERSEIAACFGGVPGHDVGLMCDVIEGCGKAEGMSILVRSMSPMVIVTDEIGSPADADALLEASRCGVGVVASAHATGWNQVRRKAGVAEALESGAFHTCLVLRRRGATVFCWEAIDIPAGRDLLSRPVPLVGADAGGGVHAAG